MNDKMKLAAISAVISMMSGEQSSDFVEKIPPHLSTTWTSWGRQQTMQYRDIVQRRIIKRNK